MTHQRPLIEFLMDDERQRVRQGQSGSNSARASMQGEHHGNIRDQWDGT